MPATAARAAPITNVIEMVRSVSTPSSAAMVWSCSQARMSRPRRVRDTIKLNIGQLHRKAVAVEQRETAGNDRRHRLDLGALRHLREVRQHERHADCRQ